MDDVLITGLGVITCLGSGADRFWDGMMAARSTPARKPDPYSRMDLPLVYSVPPADMPPAHGDGAPAPGLASSLALEAGRQSILDAGLTTVDAGRTAVVIGTCMGDSGLHESWHVGGFPSGGRWESPFSVCSTVASWLGAAGTVSSVSNACAASGFALSQGADLIRTGEADVVVAGGTEGYSRIALACFNRLGAVDPERCRPFDRDRSGTVFGEGAAVLVLESVRHAAARGAPRRYARLAGAGWSCDAYHQTAPEPTGKQIDRAMREALADADTGPADIGLVVPHGTGTELNDRVESHVLTQVLGDHAHDTPLYSLKGLIGHTGGAAGALAVAAAALMVHRSCVPPNVPLGEQDPECPVFLPTAATRLARPAALINAYAFGGNNISLVLKGVHQ